MNAALEIELKGHSAAQRAEAAWPAKVGRPQRDRKLSTAESLPNCDRKRGSKMERVLIAKIKNFQHFQPSNSMITFLKPDDLKL